MALIFYTVDCKIALRQSKKCSGVRHSRRGDRGSYQGRDLPPHASSPRATTATVSNAPSWVIPARSQSATVCVREPRPDRTATSGRAEDPRRDVLAGTGEVDPYRSWLL